MSSTSQWWDNVLNGQIWRIDAETTGYDNLAACRAAVYRQAEARHRLVATHKLGVDTLLIQAWGAAGLAQEQPRLARATATPAPPLYRRMGEPPKLLPGLVAVPVQPSPLPPQFMHSSTDQSPAPADPATTSSNDEWEPLTPEEEDALLGPCSCGQSPKCLPSCSRFN